MPRLTEAGLSSFSAEFEAVAGAVGVVARDLRFGDRRVRLRFAGEGVAEVLWGALAAREVADHGEPDASISVWESPARAVPVPWRFEEVGPGGLVRGSRADGMLAIHETGSGAVTVIDPAERMVWHRVPAAERVPWWERAAPLRSALYWALAGQGRHLVHAGAVGDDRGGLLLAGASGSGKTTLALAALDRGLGYVADDYVLVDPRDEPTAHAIYETAKLDHGHLKRFPELAAMVRHPPSWAAHEKSVLDVARLWSGSVRDWVVVRAVVVPRIGGGRSRVWRVSAAQALLALAPSTVFQMPFDDGRVLGSLADLVRRVPCFALAVGDHPGELADALDRALQEAVS